MPPADDLTWPDLSRHDLFMKSIERRAAVLRPLIEVFGMTAVCERWNLAEFTVKNWLKKGTENGRLV